jgi:hypothetical protein
MTAKQKANRERFKAAIKEAAKIRAKNPKLTQAEAVKKAWAIIYTKKRPTKKISGADILYKGFLIKKYNEGYTVLDKDGYDIAGEYFSSLKLAKSAADDEIENSMGAVKRKTVKKKAPSKSYHKDTKSHNVNIKVVSGYKSNKNDAIEANKKEINMLLDLQKKYLNTVEQKTNLINELTSKIKNKDYDIRGKKLMQLMIIAERGDLKYYKKSLADIKGSLKYLTSKKF